MVTTRVYIDGFNLYHGIIHANRLHWLNLEELARRLNRGYPVDQVIYCTAMVASSPNDPGKADRQDAYHRALRAACGKVEILKGNFSSHKKHMALAGCKNDPTCAVKVTQRTEKGSDVNLAARLVHDAHTGRFDRAIVVSGDSDLVEPIRLVAREVGKPVWVRNPRDRESDELMAVASDYARITIGVVAASQFPDPLIVGGKSFYKPAKWSQPLKPGKRTEVLTVSCPQAGCPKMVTTCRWE
jgi:uncharacterized LabA/DUF88 family protein